MNHESLHEWQTRWLTVGVTIDFGIDRGIKCVGYVVSVFNQTRILVRVTLLGTVCNECCNDMFHIYVYNYEAIIITLKMVFCNMQEIDLSNFIATVFRQYNSNITKPLHHILSQYTLPIDYLELICSNKLLLEFSWGKFMMHLRYLTVENFLSCIINFVE